MTERTAFRPDWVSPPGDTIADMLEEREWKQLEAAARLDFSPKHLSLLINGKVPLTDAAALRLSRVLGGSMAFWLGREAQYRAALAEQAEAEKLAGWTHWLDQLPVKELMDCGAIRKQRMAEANKPGIVHSLLQFYGVANPDAWASQYQGMEVAYRRSRVEQSDVGAISAWLRLGEIQAEGSDGPPFNAAAFKQALTAIRGMTVTPPKVFEPLLRQHCHEAGVALVLVPAIPRAHVSGVARWLNPHRALIQLSLYGKSNDRFWFTFFHEAAHILLHSKDKKSVFLDEHAGKAIESAQEDEANAWAAEYLIPKAYADVLPTLRTPGEITALAHELNLHPGIVVGRLQHDGHIGYATPLNGLKQTFRFAEPQ